MSIMTKFTRAEVEASILDPNAPLGRGGYGTVHRGRLRGLDVAIKILDADSMQGRQESDKEVLVLGSLHHPHLLPLLRSCPDLHALVYPYMEKGSLQQHLLGHSPAARNNSASSSTALASAQPLRWWDRVRICHETVLALMWLHGRDPPIWHMDVKPDNILLDRSNAAKLADVGIARLHEPRPGGPNVPSTTTIRMPSTIRGTPGYMAPEYLQNGRKGAFTDTYAIGVIMCQLLSGKGVCDAVDALQDTNDQHIGFTTPAGAAALQQLLDPTAEWPEEFAAQLAAVAMCCLDRHTKRPHLSEVLEPALAALSVTAAEAKAQADAAEAGAAPDRSAATVGAVNAATPNSLSTVMLETLACDICHEQFTDPVTTPAGNTFCRGCIMGWLNSGHNTCPKTRQPLRASQLAPNYVVQQLLEQLQEQEQGQEQDEQPRQQAGRQPMAQAAAPPIHALGGQGSVAATPQQPTPAAAPHAGGLRQAFSHFGSVRQALSGSPPNDRRMYRRVKRTVNGQRSVASPINLQGQVSPTGNNASGFAIVFGGH